MHIAETRVETIQLVMPEHANPLGNLFGGMAMRWMTTAGTLAASRLARGPVVLGSMNNIDFLSPVHIGDLAVLTAQVEWTGKTSMELCIELVSERPSTGVRRRTTLAHMAYVAIDEKGHPRRLPSAVQPDGADEAAIYQAASQRKEDRLRRMAERRERQQSDEPPWPEAISHGVESWRIVFPENAIAPGIMFAGDLMMDIDEIGGILAHRYSHSMVVTASIDGMDFLHPIAIGDLVLLRAALNHVGRSSMEIGVRVYAEQPSKGTRTHTCSAYLTFVALDEQGTPRPAPPFEPKSPEERARQQAAEQRRAARRKKS